MRMPSACVAVSRSYIESETRSASVRASAVVIGGWCSPTQRPSGGGPPGDERRDAVAVLAIMQGEMRDGVADHGRADRVPPRQRTARIVDALLHREVDRVGCRHALDDRVG